MGCFWSKEDEERPPVSRSRRRGDEEINSFRSTIRENSISIPRQYVIRTPVIQNPTHSFISANNQSNQLQTRQVTRNIVVPKVKPRIENSNERPTQGLHCRPAINVESNLRAVNQNNIERPKFGEYKCNKCGRAWKSRLCWPDKYQICKYCRKPVYAHSHRELEPSDFIYDEEKKAEHPKELCGKCKQLGHYCNTRQKFLRQSKVFKAKLHSQSRSRIYKRD